MMFNRVYTTAGVLCLALALFGHSAMLYAQQEEGPFPGWTEQSFLIGYGNAQRAWVDEIPAQSNWQPVEQADLAEQLGSAGSLELQQVGPAVRTGFTTRGQVIVVPKDDGTWNALFHYYRSYSGEQEIIAVDLSTGAQNHFLFNSDREGGIPDYVNPYGSYFANGKLFFMTPPDGFYDPQTNQVTYVPNSPPGFRCHAMRVAADENIYLLGGLMGQHSRESEGFMAGIMDTTTGKVNWHEPFGPSSKRVSIFYSWSILDGDWMYAIIAHRPWYLLAYNFKTRENRVIATSPTRIERDTIRMSLLEGGGLRCQVKDADFVNGLSDFDSDEVGFWVKDGKVFPRTGDIPPWSETPVRDAPRDASMQRPWSGIQYWPAGWTAPSPPPIFPSTQGHASPPPVDGHGNVTYRYQYQGDDQWHDVSFTVSTFEDRTTHLTEINENVIYGTGGFYANSNFFDVTDKKMMVPPAMAVAPYATRVIGDHFYITGYPNSILADYDLTRAFTTSHDDPNPLVRGIFGPHSDTHYPTGGIARGGDGRIYTGGSGAGRQRHGGGWSWYDPATGQAGGQQLEGNITSLISVLEGRYILMSIGAQLHRFDTTTHSFLEPATLSYDAVPLRPRYMVEALPGLVIGYSQLQYPEESGKDAQPVLYGLDPQTHTVLWVKPVPAPPTSVRMPMFRSPYLFRIGPDGFIWTYMNDVLVRIDPRNAQVHPVGQPPRKAFIGFAGGDVYIGGQVGLQRIKDLTVEIVNPRTE